MKKTIISAGLLTVAALVSATVSAQELSIKVTNLTNAIYFTPLLVAAHSSHVNLFENDAAFVEADIGLTERALENLIDNTIEHPPSGGTLTLPARTLQGAVEVSVRDSGCGISTTELLHIFDCFYQVINENRQPGHHQADYGVAPPRDQSGKRT